MKFLNKNNKGFLSVPIAIIVAGLIVAGAIVYSSGKKAVFNEPAGNQGANPAKVAANMKAVGKDDHIFGDPKAKVKIVEFSDAECPFCKRFHPTLQKIVADYDGQVAWVYRHFPLDSIHSKARKEAEATECAAEVGGNDAFWKYLDRLLEVTPSNNGLSLAMLPAIAEYAGLDRTKFEECLNSGRHADRVQSDYEDAVATGGQGTPFSIVIAPNGDRLPVEGAQPYSSVKQVIDIALGLK